MGDHAVPLGEHADVPADLADPGDILGRGQGEVDRVGAHLVEDRLASARPAVCGAGWGGGRGVHATIVSYPGVFV